MFDDRTKTEVHSGIQAFCYLPKTPLLCPGALAGNARDSLDTLPKDRPRRLVLGVRAEGDRVVYTVEDNGPGISKEDQARIFDPFFTTKEAAISLLPSVFAEKETRERKKPA